MCRRFLIAAVLLSTASSIALGAPYAWIPGSSADTPETGNKMVIVDLGARTPIGLPGGFVFTDESEGADPLIPTFSPNGDRAYIVAGGDEDLPAPRPGHLYVFDTAAAIGLLESLRAAPTAMQKIVITPDSDSAVEPIAITMSPAGNKVVVTESEYDKIYVYTVLGDGTLDDDNKTVLASGGDPSPAWIKNDGTRAYFCTSRVYSGTNVTQEAKLKVIDLTANPPAIIATIDVPSPTQGGGILLGLVKSIPVTTCAFAVPAGANNTVVQPPEVDAADDSELYIFSGFAGFLAKVTSPISQTFVLNDPFNIYKLNTATNQLTNGGSPIRTVTPGSSQVTFPPLIHAYQIGVAPFAEHAAGTHFKRPNGTLDTFIPSSNDYILLFGLAERTGTHLYIGSIAGANGNELVNGNYVPLQQTSNIYKARIHTTRKDNRTLPPLFATQRSMSVPLGFTSDSMVIGATDGFFVFDVPSGGNAAVARKTLLYFLTLSNDAVSVPLDLGIVAGAYAQQPVPAAPENNILAQLLGSETSAFDINGDGIVDAADLVRQVLDN